MGRATRASLGQTSDRHRGDRGHRFLNALQQQESSEGLEPRAGWAEAGVCKNSLSGQVAPAAGLEPDDDVGDLQVSLLLQVGQHTGPEEDLALADAVQVAVELQGFNLDGREPVIGYAAPRSPRTRPRACLSQGSG